MKIQHSENQVNISIGGGKKPYGKAKRFVLNFFEGKLGGHWSLFWALFLMTLYPMLSQLSEGWPDNRFLLCLAAYSTAYTYTYIGSLIKQKVLRNIFFTIVFVIVFVHSSMLTACMHTVNAVLDRDLVTAILATNTNEASEFFSAYFTPQVIIVVSTLIILLIGTFILFKKVHFRTSAIACRIGVIAFLICIVVSVANFWIFRYTSVGFVKNVVLFINSPKVEVHQSTPKLTINSNNQPPLIVWIIGESLTNHHCSLYGYDKPTNPFTKEKVTKGEVLLFKNVKAAGTYTQDCFQKMMSTYEKSMGNKVKWNECPTLPNIVKAANYRTYWISNQSKKGLYDNVVSQYSDFCDTCVFIGNMFAGTARTNYDGELLSVFKSMLKKYKTVHDFYILHLMGCHEDFEKRYPSSFNYFKERDYKKYPESQRTKRAFYDNAVRYNDYVVNSVFNLISKRDAIVIYTPDHGLDIFESNPNVAAHSNNSNPVSVKAALDIPFLIYMTPLFRERHGDFAQRAINSTNRSFDMENIVYLMMDMMQCDFKNHTVAQKSLTRR